MTTEPNWDMTPYFEAFGETQYRGFRESLERDVKELQEQVAALDRLDASSLTQWADFLVRLEAVTARSTHLASYLGCLSAAASHDEEIRSETASAAAARAELEKVFVGVRAAFGVAPQGVFDQLVGDPKLEAVGFYLERLRVSARWRMDPELEALATDLAIDGISAWGRLYDQVSGQLTFELSVPGRETRRIPVSMTRSLLENPDSDTRRAALEGSNAAWEGVADVAAACLNGIAGVRHTLYRRRGVSQFLEPPLFDAAISRKTLEALLEAVASRQEIARRYLRTKARILGQPQLGFQDLMAPLPLQDSTSIPWSEAKTRILGAFGRFYPELASFAARAFERRWIDYEPRDGKRPGGFCSTSPVIGESRIFLTYNDTLGDVATVAHELGHAFHGGLMRDMRCWSRRYPMTLAETASTFAEQLVIDAVLDDEKASPEVRATALDSRMQDGATFLLNIPTRFYFEEAFYQERKSGEVSVSRLKELMTAAQRRCYGDCLKEEELDPWFWASKLHFYITGLSFYNFPYTFGYLFSLGIFARAKREGPAFLKRYEELLRLTGSDTAEGVARRCLGVDLERPDFWNESIDWIERDLEQFETTTQALFASQPQRAPTQPE